MNQQERKLGLGIFDVGAVKTKEQSPGGKGFKLKLHEKDPKAPLSPIFMNLRVASNPKQGPLTAEIVDDMGALLYELAKARGFDCEYVAGVPNAGDPLADALVKAAAKDGVTANVIRMEKTEGEGGRQVARLLTHVEKGKPVLIIDDLITRAGSKVEAIKVLTSAGLHVTGVVVLIDRQQGGIDDLRNANGIDCDAVFKILDLMELYSAEGRISEATRAEVVQYITAKK